MTDADRTGLFLCAYEQNAVILWPAKPENISFFQVILC